jgi:hypothetical protein
VDASQLAAACAVGRGTGRMSGVATGAGVTDTEREGEGMCPQEMGGTAEVIHIAIKSAARYNEQGDEMLACLRCSRDV